MTFEARDSAAKVVPARFKLSTNNRGNGARLNSSRRPTGKIFNITRYTLQALQPSFHLLVGFFFGSFRFILDGFSSICLFAWLPIFFSTYCIFYCDNAPSSLWVFIRISHLKVFSERDSQFFSAWWRWQRAKSACIFLAVEPPQFHIFIADVMCNLPATLQKKLCWWKMSIGWNSSEQWIEFELANQLMLQINIMLRVDALHLYYIVCLMSKWAVRKLNMTTAIRVCVIQSFSFTASGVSANVGSQTSRWDNQMGVFHTSPCDSSSQSRAAQTAALVHFSKLLRY